MFTQFFGNYLVSEDIITQKQLFNSINIKKNIKVKLGVLAINAGLLTSRDVEFIHEKQMTEDKPFGYIAFSLGIITQEQIDSLLVSQMPDYLLLGQALIDLDAIDNATFEKALKDYKEKFSIDDDDLKKADSKKYANIIKGFFDFSKCENQELMIEYAELLIKNLIRFVGDDFILLNPDDFDLSEYDKCYAQDIMVEFSTTLNICGDDKALIGFASRYAGEDFSEFDEYVEASVSDFINLHNGLFIVNVSQTQGIELTLTPPETRLTDTISKNSFVILARYPFGLVNFIFV
jgi:hypothetical protein